MLWDPSAFPQPAASPAGGGRWGPAAPRASPRPRPSPSTAGGGARSPFSGSAGPAPFPRACLMLLGRRGLVPLSSAGEKKRGVHGAILRHILIRELRLPCNPTGRHCLNGRSTPKGERGTLWSESVGSELGTAPRGITPFRLRGRPDPQATSPSRTPTHRLLECLYSLFWFPETSLKFSYLGIGGRVFFWKFTRRQKGPPTQENSEPRHIPRCLGTGSLLLPSSPGSALSPAAGHAPSLGSSSSPQPHSITQAPLCPQ